MRGAAGDDCRSASWFCSMWRSRYWHMGRGFGTWSSDGYCWTSSPEPSEEKKDDWAAEKIYRWNPLQRVVQRAESIPEMVMTSSYSDVQSWMKLPFRTIGSSRTTYTPRLVWSFVDVLTSYFSYKAESEVPSLVKPMTEYWMVTVIILWVFVVCTSMNPRNFGLGFPFPNAKRYMGFVRWRFTHDWLNQS